MPPDGILSDGGGALLASDASKAPVDAGPAPDASAAVREEAKAQKEAAGKQAAEARAKKEAAAQAKAEAKARKKAAAQAKAEAQAQREAEARAKKEAEAAARAEAEARREAEAQAKREAAGKQAAEAGGRKKAARKKAAAPATPEEPSSGYILMPGDEVELLIFREPDMSGVFRLNESGELRHPVAGTLALSGKTVHEAESEVTRLLGENYLVDPRLVLRIVSARSAQVVLLGEVMKPGVYPLPYGEGLTLLQAIAGAGGFTELASPERIRIVRRNPEGGTATLRVRMSDLTRGKGGKQDIPLEPNDVIMVDEVFF